MTTGASPSWLLLPRNGWTKSADGSTAELAEPDWPTMELWVALSQPVTWALVGSRPEACTENSCSSLPSSSVATGPADPGGQKCSVLPSTHQS